MQEKLLTPIGRLVMGSLYKPNTKNMAGQPLVDKTGKPRVEYWIHLAIEKGTEQHWNQTPWGQVIQRVAMASFPDGRFNNKNFSWKVVDGDSTEANQNGRRPCDTEGYARHWILKFRNGFAPVLCNLDGSLFMQPEDAIKCGHYIQVYGSVSDNHGSATPGLFLNFSNVAFAGFGPEIVSSIDPKEIGFGGPLPAGVSSVPVGLASTQPPVPAPLVPPTPTPTPAPVPAPAPAPYTPILQPPKVMTPKANGITYEAYKQAGWSDEQLIQNGMMMA